MIQLERAELGVDGNAGFALLGENIQEGECEFLGFSSKLEIGSKEFDDAARHACTQSYKKLKERLKDREFSYFLGKSHPDYIR